MDSQYKAVLFDLDGTLADTIQDLSDAMNAALQAHGLPSYSPEEYKLLVGTGWANLVSAALKKVDDSQQTAQSVGRMFTDYYNVHYMDKTRAYDGVAELLETLRQNGIKLGVVTNKRQYMSENVLNELFGGVFTVIYGHRDEYPIKPDPAMPLAAMRDLGVKPQECVFVGDSGVDMKTAKACGALAVGVLWGFRSREELERDGADYVIEHPRQLLDILERNN